MGLGRFGRRGVLGAGLGSLAGLVLGGCGRGAGREIIEGRAMGTSWRLLWERGERSRLGVDVVRAGVVGVLESYEELVSTWRAGSALSRFNRHRGTGWVGVPERLAELVWEAQDIARRTGGALDVTVAPLVRAWGFGAGGGGRRVPSDGELAALRGRVGWERLEVNLVRSEMRKGHPELEIDLSALGEGAGIDAVVGWLEGSGETDFLFELGGELAGRGGPRGEGAGGGWRVAVEAAGAGGGLVGPCELRDEALSTSGTYRQGWREVGGEGRGGGRWLSHLIDPRLGVPVAGDLAAVSVRARRCLDADGWATALMVMGVGEGLEKAGGEGLAALFQGVGGEMVASVGWRG
jgi:FAD:protein FMN transferase